MLKPWFRFRFRPLVFLLIWVFNKVYVFQNSKLNYSKSIEIKPLHQDMAETDKIIELGWELGFLGRFLIWFTSLQALKCYTNVYSQICVYIKPIINSFRFLYCSHLWGNEVQAIDEAFGAYIHQKTEINEEPSCIHHITTLPHTSKKQQFILLSTISNYHWYNLPFFLMCMWLLCALIAVIWDLPMIVLALFQHRSIQCESS